MFPGLHLYYPCTDPAQYRVTADTSFVVYCLESSSLDDLDDLDRDMYMIEIVTCR